MYNDKFYIDSTDKIDKARLQINTPLTKRRIRKFTPAELLTIPGRESEF